MEDRIFVILFSLLLLGLSSCEKSRKYTLEELENNEYNSLEMVVKPNMSSKDLSRLVSELAVLDTSELLDVLRENNLELNRASYCFFYLANNYAKHGAMKNFVKYHQVGADKYLNPLSMLKMAYVYHRGLPQCNIEADAALAYDYLHRCLEVVEMAIEHGSHILSEKTKESGVYLLEELRKQARAKQFQEDAIRKKLRKSLPLMLEKLKEMYQIENLVTT